MNLAKLLITQLDDSIVMHPLWLIPSEFRNADKCPKSSIIIAAIRWLKNFDDKLKSFDTIPHRDGQSFRQSDGRTTSNRTVHCCIVSRRKKSVL